MNTPTVVTKLSRLGFELIPEDPAIRVRYSGGSEPPPETPQLLEELRANKDAALHALTRWEETAERKRLESTIDRCDKFWWRGCWEWSVRNRPDLRDRIDHALDAVSEAWLLKDVATHIRACETLRNTVSEIVAAFQRAEPTARTIDPSGRSN